MSSLVINTLESRQQVTFIDISLPNYQTLIDGLPEGMAVVLVAPNQDGIQVMADWAKNHSDYSAIHILGHGSTGAQQLGSATLSFDTLNQYQTQLSQIGSSLTQDGDILLYGCNVAAEQAGVDFIGKLAQATGADIAASDDLTMPLGLISFKADVSNAGAIQNFNLLVSDEAAVNGYWKQDNTGSWVNLASEAYGGSVSQVGNKLQLSFMIKDGGMFDDDGVITDPGALGFRDAVLTPVQAPFESTNAFFDWMLLG